MIMVPSERVRKSEAFPYRATTCANLISMPSAIGSSYRSSSLGSPSHDAKMMTAIFGRLAATSSKPVMKLAAQNCAQSVRLQARHSNAARFAALAQRAPLHARRSPR